MSGGYADEDGTVVDPEISAEPGSCVVCGRPCSLLFGSDVAHVRCWVTSTARSRGTRAPRRRGPRPTEPAAPTPDEPALFDVAADAAASGDPQTAPGDAGDDTETDNEVPVAPAEETPASPDAPVEEPEEVPAPAAPEPADDVPAEDQAVTETGTDDPPAPAEPDAAESGPAAAAVSLQDAMQGRAEHWAPAVVLDADGIWLPDGTLVAPPHPLQHVGDVARLVKMLGLGTETGKGHVEPGQVWLTAAALHQLGVDVDDLATGSQLAPPKVLDRLTEVTGSSTFVTDALDAGWTLDARRTSLGRFTRVRPPNAAGRDFVWVAVIPALDRTWPMLADTPASAQLARRLAKFADALHYPWFFSPSATGIDLQLATRPDKKTEFFTPRAAVEPSEHDVAADITWTRTPSAAESALHWIHAYDRGGSHIAGAAGLELGWGDPEHHELGCRFDPKLPGYWLIEVGDAADWRLPNLLWHDNTAPRDPVWVATPTLELALAHDQVPAILEAYTWPRHTRILDPWYARIRDARTALDTADPDDQVARAMVKTVYTQTLGMMGSAQFMADRDGYAPERRHMIQAKARANILRRVIANGELSDRWPLAIDADTIIYASDEPNPEKAWPGKPGDLGRGMGKYKPEGSGLMAEQARFFTGERYLGKGELR